MKNQELLKELKSFPKEYQPDGERQINTLKNIMNFYDEYEKKNKNPFSFQKWQAAAAGLAAVILASFLFLPNILNHENKSHQANPPEEKKNMVNTPTDDKKDLDVTPSEQFYPKELTEVKAISIVKPKGIGQEEITDTKLIDPIVQIFKQAKLVEKQNIEKENSMNDHPPYLISFQLKDGFISVNYWPDEKGANMIDIQQRSWWRVDRLSMVLDKMIEKTSAESINYALALTNLKALHPDINWEKEYSLSLINENKGLLATGVEQSSQELIQIELNAVTGTVIKEEVSESTDAAKKAVQTFFRLVGSGNVQTAWDLIHPRSKEPNPALKEEQTKKSFDNYFASHHLGLKSIDSVEWTPNEVKFPDCMCIFIKEILIKATLTDGTKTEFHAIKDDNNQWKLYWSTINNKLM